MTARSREEWRDALVERSRTDRRVVTAALVGSAARGDEDEWSDIDLALRLAQDLPEGSLDEVAGDWTCWVSNRAEVVDTMDLWAGGGLYRVFLLGSGLQVDLSFFPYDAFGPTTGDPVVVVHGEPAPLPRQPAVADWQARAQWGWLLLLHVRSALGRGRLWQAELMLADLRSVVLELAALRLGLRSDHGRSAHLLPLPVQDRLAQARAKELEAGELARSARLTAECLVAELRAQVGDDADRLADVCRRIAAGEHPS